MGMKQSCLLWPSFAAMVFRRIEKEPLASVLRLWVLPEMGNGTQEVAYKEHEHKAAQKQCQRVKKAGARDPGFNISSAKNIQIWSCPNQLTSPCNLFSICSKKWNCITFESKWHGPHKWHSAADLHYHSSLSELLHLVKNLQLSGIWGEKYCLMLWTYSKVGFHLCNHSHYSLRFTAGLDPV